MRIELSHVRKEFAIERDKSVVAISDVTLEVGEGEFVALVGQSGCGKSTVLNIICGLEQCSGGEIRIGGTPVTPSNPAPANIGYVFQQPRLLPWKTVRGNAEYVLKASNVPKEQWGELIQANLEMLGLAEFADAYPSQLSGGMRARAGILRAYVIRPDILLMDEPFSGLDEMTARRMRSEILEIWGKRVTTLFVTHDLSEAVYLAQRIVVLTGRPSSVYKEYSVQIDYPRSYTDERLFDLEKAIFLDLYNIEAAMATR